MTSSNGRRRRLQPVAVLIALLAFGGAQCTMTGSAAGNYDDLVQLFKDWREFETPPMLDGAPDYTAERFAAAHRELADYQARLSAIDPSGWPIEQQVDWHIVRAEMNGFDFNHRVLKPWVRDPAYYQSVWTEQERRTGARGAHASRRPRALDLRLSAFR